MDVNTVVQHQNKIQTLFGKFLEPNFEIKNDTYLSRLLTHLSNQEKPVDATLVDNSFFSDWLLHAVSVWETNSITPSVNISSFTLTLASFISRNEDRFSSLNSNGFYEKLIQVVRARQADVAPSVKLGYIKLLSSFLEHKSGIQWITSCDFWMDVLRLTLTNQTVYITREGYRFMSKILEQTIDHNESFCHNVVKQTMLPLEENTNKTIRTTGDMMEISDEAVHQNLAPTLQLIANILEYFLESVLFAQNDCRIVLIFLRDFHLEQQICNYMMIAQNKYLIFDLGKIMFMMQFLEFYIGVISENLKKADVSISIRKIMSIFTTNTSRGYFENIMKLCFYGQYYWNLMGYKIPCIKVNKDNEPISFANQLLVIQLLPIFALAMKYCVGDHQELLADEFRDQYVHKLFMMMCENTVRIAYGWRDFLIAQPNLFEIATKGLIYVMKSRKYYPRERAAMAFQSFVYALKDVMRAIKETPEKSAFFAQQINFFSLLFDAFVVFIEEFQITWRDSVETICVMAICFDFLSVPTWPMQLVVKALKLVNVSLVKYMSPNLALLVDRTNDSTLAVLGSLLNTKLHDMTWEVRDSALEVVCTISYMSSTKVESTLVVLPIFSEWVKGAVGKWSVAKVTPQTHIACFTLSIASLLSKNEERFCSLNNNNFFIKLVNVVKARHCRVATSVKLGYIKLLMSFLAHISGVEWMIACNFWEDILQLSLLDQNEEVVRESTRFMWTLLEKTVVVDEVFCNNIVKRIMLPLGENMYKTIKVSSSSSMEVTEDVASEYLKPTLKLMGKILEYFLEEINFDRGDFQVLFVFLKNFHLEERISDFMIIAQSRCLASDLGKIMFIMQFLELYVKALTNTLCMASINATIRRIKNNFQHNISKGKFEDCVEFCNFGQLFWSLMDAKIPVVQTKNDNEPTCFVDQFILIQTLPYYGILYKNFWKKEEITALLDEDVRNLYVQKIFKLISHDAIRICYYWRDNIVDRPDVIQLAILCTDRLIKYRKYLSRDQATLVVQCVIYNILDIVNCVKESPKKIENIVNETTYIVKAADILMIFIKEFHITWKDSLEATDLLVISFNFLLMHSWPASVVVQILKLINVATANYMAPNLALLVDRTEDSTTSLLGPILYAKLHDEILEVKGAALEIIRTMATMSNSRFFQFLVKALILSSGKINNLKDKTFNNWVIFLIIRLFRYYHKLSNRTCKLVLFV